MGEPLDKVDLGRWATRRGHWRGAQGHGQAALDNLGKVRRAMGEGYGPWVVDRGRA